MPKLISLEALKFHNFKFFYFILEYDPYLVWGMLETLHVQKQLANSLAISNSKDFEYLIYFIKNVKNWADKSVT